MAFGPCGRSSLCGETPPRIETNSEAGQYSLGGAYGQKQCSGISGSRHGGGAESSSRERQQQHPWWK